MQDYSIAHHILFGKLLSSKVKLLGWTYICLRARSVEPSRNRGLGSTTRRVCDFQLCNAFLFETLELSIINTGA